MNVGVVGAGSIARVHVAALRALGVSTTVYARQRRQAMNLAIDGVTLADSYSDLVAHSNLVVIATPPGSHLALASEALQAGCDVLCEKPLGRSPSEVRELIDIAARTPGQLWPAHVVRFDPSYVELRRLVSEGTLGEPMVTEFVRRNEAPPRGSWFWDPAESGGVIGDLMIHDIDFALWVFGDVRRVFAVRREQSSASARVLLEHAGGSVSLIVGNWAQAPVDFASGYRCLGTRGSADYSSSEPIMACVRGIDSRQWHKSIVQDRSLRPYIEQLTEVLAAQANPSSLVRVSAIEALHTAEIIEAAHRSIDVGAWMTVPA